MTDTVFDYNALKWLAFALPLLVVPALTIVSLIVETPVLRREPATPGRRNAATVLAIISLIVAAPLAAMSWALGAFGVLLLLVLAVPAILTLMRLRQQPPETTP